MLRAERPGLQAFYEKLGFRVSTVAMERVRREREVPIVAPHALRRACRRAACDAATRLAARLLTFDDVVRRPLP